MGVREANSALLIIYILRTLRSKSACNRIFRIHYSAAESWSTSWGGGSYGGRYSRRFRRGGGGCCVAPPNTGLFSARARCRQLDFTVRKSLSVRTLSIRAPREDVLQNPYLGRTMPHNHIWLAVSPHFLACPLLPCAYSLRPTCVRISESDAWSKSLLMAPPN